MVSLKHAESTIDDLMALPEDTRAELIDGVIYMMAPALARHSLINGVLNFKISAYLDQKQKKGSDGGESDSWLIIPEAWVFYDRHNSFVHDIAGYLEKDLPSFPESGPITVRPTWVCETISPSNWSNDTQRKRVILEEHKVPCYWLVDPERKSIQVFEMAETDTRYQFAYSVGVEDGVVKLPPFLELELDLKELFKR